jgi:hypothetical protein
MVYGLNVLYHIEERVLRQVTPEKCASSVTQRAHVHFFQRRRVIINQAVHSTHVMPLSRKTLCEMRADESGRSCHHYPHIFIPCLHVFRIAG